jgi:hypothetical protein
MPGGTKKNGSMDLGRTPYAPFITNPTDMNLETAQAYALIIMAMGIVLVALVVVGTSKNGGRLIVGLIEQLLSRLRGKKKARLEPRSLSKQSSKKPLQTQRRAFGKKRGLVKRDKHSLKSRSENA